MESSDIISDLINENQIDSEKISAEMEMLDKLALNADDDKIRDQSLTPIEDENSNSAVDAQIETREITDKNEVELEDKITRPCQFAVSRIKTIMKLDPDLALASKESVFAIAKATVN